MEQEKDIVERLRRWGDPQSNPLMNEAADEIERLRATLKVTQDALDVGYAVAEGESFDKSMAIIDAAIKMVRATLGQSGA